MANDLLSNVIGASAREKESDRLWSLLAGAVHQGCFHQANDPAKPNDRTMAGLPL